MKVKLLSVLIVSTLLFSSCEKEEVTTVEPPKFDITLGIIRQFLELTYFNRPSTTPSGVIAKQEPKRLMGIVKVYLDESVNDSDKIVIDNFLTKVSQFTAGSGVTFVYTNDIDDFTIGIVNGPASYMNSVFGTNSNPPDWWFGGVTGYSECTHIYKRLMWYDPEHSREKTIRHELGHTLGLGHTDFGNSLMYKNLGKCDEFLSDTDISTLKLLYYNGEYGPIAPNYSGECTDDDFYIYDYEEEAYRQKLRDIILNDYN